MVYEVMEKKEPYEGVSLNRVVIGITSGALKPELSFSPSPLIAKLMVRVHSIHPQERCFQLAPKKRPSFHRILRWFDDPDTSDYDSTSTAHSGSGDSTGYSSS